MEGGEDVGGFFGEAYEYDFFINCYAAGSVAYKGTGPGATRPSPYIGAFIGYTDYPDKLDFCQCLCGGERGLPLFWSYDGDADVALEEGRHRGLTLSTLAAPRGGEMLDAFNEIVGPYGEEFREELFRWAGSNEKKTGRFSPT